MRNGFFLWWMVLLAVITLSCVNQPFFAESYHRLLDWLAIPAGWRRYLLVHYKLGHPFFYALLATLTTVYFNRYLRSLFLVFALGALLELVQLFLPTRSARWTDLLYNLSGITIGFLFTFLMSCIRKYFKMTSFFGT